MFSPQPAHNYMTTTAVIVVILLIARRRPPSAVIVDVVVVQPPAEPRAHTLSTEYDCSGKNVHVCVIRQ